jgi:acyl-coenzyme A synthetase/AMP-(fatty) acid ligase
VRSSSYNSLARQAKLAPDQYALVSAELSLTFGEALGLTESIAGQLRGAGVRSGMRVGIAVSLEAEWATLIALDNLGACAAVIRTESHLQRVQDLGFDYLVTGMSGLKVAKPPVIPVDFSSKATARADGSVPHRWLPEEPYRLIFTSGTTGTPKAVELSFAQFSFRAEHSLIGWQSKTPLITLFGLDSALAPLVMANALEDGKPQLMALDGDDVARFIKSWRVKVVHGSERQFAQIIKPKESFGEGVERIIIAGSYPSDSSANELRKFFPGAEIWVHFGSTEAGQTFFSELNTESRSLGKPVQGIEVSLRLIDGWPSDTGLLTVLSEGVVKSYVADEHSSQEHFSAEGFISGDLVRRSPGGEFFLMGREGNVINIEGFKFTAEDLESYLESSLSGLTVVASQESKTLILRCQSEKDFSEQAMQRLVHGFCGFEPDLKLIRVSQIGQTPSGKKIRVP